MTKNTLLRLLLAAFFPLTILFSACNDEPDLTGDYKNITITYGILNMNDPVHYIKVYKGYLTDENALVEASDWNNIYYNVDSIEVRLEEYNASGVLQRSAVLDTTTQVGKEEGYFANPRQLLYFSTWQLNPECKYRIVIKNRNSGEEIYAQTTIVGDCKFSRTIQINQNPFNAKDDLAPDFTVTALNGSPRDQHVAVGDFYLTFHYIEVDNNTQAVTHKSIRKRLNGSFVYPNSNGELQYNSFKTSDLLRFIGQSIEANPNVVRYIDTVNANPYYCLKMEVWTANDIFKNYYNISHPRGGISQDRLEYTNFVSENENAYGILASRNCFSSLFKFDNTSGKHNEDSLVYGSYTKDLNFGFYRNSPEFYEVPNE
ncbi:MAG: hypothetical protein J6Z44_02470 [Bacteroidales bacterium]|nr:hypothetical protein [Bacteroidales bacterium]